MELCGGDGCHESEILAFDFQRRAWEYYEARKDDATCISSLHAQGKLSTGQKAGAVRVLGVGLVFSFLLVLHVVLLLVACVWHFLGKSKGKASAPPLEEASLIMSMPVEEACPILAHWKTWPK